MKKPILVALKILFTVVLLYLVVRLVNVDELMTVVSSANIKLLILALIFHALAFVVMSVRWWLILATCGEHIRYKFIFNAYYFGLFCNNFLPTSMGGDVVRIAALRARGINTSRLIFSTVTDRVIGLISILIMGIIGINFSSSVIDSLDENSLTAVNVTSAIIIIGFLLALNTAIREKVVHLLNKLFGTFTRLKNFLAYCHDSLSALNNNVIVVKAVFLSVCSQLLVILTYFTIGLSLNLNLSFLEFVLIVPIVFLFASLPISVGGLGVREGILVLLLNAVGVSDTSAVSVSLIYLTILIMTTLPGGVYLLSSQRRTSGSEAKA